MFWYSQWPCLTEEGVEVWEVMVEIWGVMTPEHLREVVQRHL